MDLPCPFCGGKVDPEGWYRNDGVKGPECNGCGATAESMEAWNRRTVPVAEPVAWMNRGPNGDQAPNLYVNRAGFPWEIPLYSTSFQVVKDEFIGK